ncbi:hypothetical protein Cgig2_006612 [Carnegiea gigantea]|uniref:Uncharacterized protein n=1 Tax=Carnegiea gigantea TaxID=171969 RepID=A0A9Q1QM88_9CARY|nr:hypothetical protein Cgig2_006612 [Carnegiea gigantea]
MRNAPLRMWPLSSGVTRRASPDLPRRPSYGAPSIARECYLVSNRPLLKWTSGQGPGGPLAAGKRPQTEPPLPPPAAEALVIHTMASAEPDRPCAEAAESYTSGSPSSSLPPSSAALWPSSFGVPASLSRGFVSSSSRPSPSIKGGLNSTKLGFQPSALTSWRSSMYWRALRVSSTAKGPGARPPTDRSPDR